MLLDEYWDKFVADGKIESYLSYKQHLNSQENYKNGTSTVFDGRPDNKGTEYR